MLFMFPCQHRKRRPRDRGADTRLGEVQGLVQARGLVVVFFGSAGPVFCVAAAVFFVPAVSPAVFVVPVVVFVPVLVIVKVLVILVIIRQLEQLVRRQRRGRQPDGEVDPPAEIDFVGEGGEETAPSFPLVVFFADPVSEGVVGPAGGEGGLVVLVAAAAGWGRGLGRGRCAGAAGAGAGVAPVVADLLVVVRVGVGRGGCGGVGVVLPILGRAV